jgi:hypothetical protein
METLLQLKEKLSDVTTDAFANDWYLMMWLKFHKMDVNKTEAVIRMSVGHRQKFGLATVSKNDFPEPLPNEVPILAKDGLSPVIIFRVGFMHFRSLKKKYGKSNFLRMVAGIYYNAEKEFIQRVNAKYEDLETKCNLDFSVLTIGDHTSFSALENANPSVVDMFLDLTNTGNEVIHWLVASKTVVINATAISAVTVKGVQLFMPRDVIVFREGDEGWKQAVANYIEPDTVTAVLRA